MAEYVSTGPFGYVGYEFTLTSAIYVYSSVWSHTIGKERWEAGVTCRVIVHPDGGTAYFKNGDKYYVCLKNLAPLYPGNQWEGSWGWFYIPEVIDSHTCSYTIDSGIQYSAATCIQNRFNYLKCSCSNNPMSPDHIIEIQGTKVDHTWPSSYTHVDSNNISGGCRYANCTVCSRRLQTQYGVWVNAGTGISSVSGQEWYDEGSTVKIDAFVDAGYAWSHWDYTNNGVYGTSAIKNWAITPRLSHAWSITAHAVPNTHSLDVNGLLDNNYGSNIEGYGTCDVYVNGILQANDCSDYYSHHTYGSTYEIKDIKATIGHTYDGVYTGSLSGVIGTSDVNVQLKFHTNSYILTFVSEGTVIETRPILYGQAYGELPVPSREGYVFSGWYTEADDGIQVNSDVRMGASDVIVYARWNKVGLTYIRVNGVYRKAAVYVKHSNIYKPAMGYSRDDTGYRN